MARRGPGVMAVPTGLPALLAGEAEARPYPEWLAPRRRESWRRFSADPTPDREAWRYTDLRAITGRQWQAAAAAAAGDLVVPRLDGDRLVFVDGRAEEDASWGGRRAHLLGDQPEPVGHLPNPLHPYADLNLALFDDAAVVAGTAHVVHVSTGQEGRVHHPRTLVRIPRGGKAIVVEQYLSSPAAGGTSWTDAATEIVVEDGARLAYVRLQDEHHESVHTGSVAARVGQDARLAMYDVAFGAGHARVTADLRLSGEGAELALDGLVAAKGKQRCDTYTRIDHAVPHTTSRERYLTILADSAQGGFTGHIHVAHAAQQTQSEQEHRNLLLSREALAQTTPQLEINADDVKCSHGSTVGQLDEAALFFLRSRGIGHDRARAMLVQGFAEEIVGGLPVLGDHVSSRVRDWFGGAA